MDGVEILTVSADRTQIHHHLAPSFQPYINFIQRRCSKELLELQICFFWDPHMSPAGPRGRGQSGRRPSTSTEPAGENVSFDRVIKLDALVTHRSALIHCGVTLVIYSKENLQPGGLLILSWLEKKKNERVKKQKKPPKTLAPSPQKNTAFLLR